MSARLLKAAAVGLTLGLVALSGGDLSADVKVKDAQKHIDTLRTTKDAKAKMVFVDGQLYEPEEVPAPSPSPKMEAGSEGGSGGTGAR